MLSLVFGLTGAGKSSFLARCASRAMRGKSLRVGLPISGGVWLQDLNSKDYQGVFSNFPLEGCYKLDFEMLGKYQISNALLLIDEIAMLFDSRDWRSFPDNAKYFFKHHRHFQTDCIVCSQSASDADKRVRDLAQNVLYLTCSGFGFSRVAPIRHTMDVRNGSIEDNYSIAAPLGRLYFRRAPYYKMFDSYSVRQLELTEFEKWDMKNV